MPSLLDLRRRIRAVKSTQQITKAMKMIAASRLRRAQDRVLGARPFARQSMELLSSLAARVDQAAHPLLTTRDESRAGSRTLLIVLSADKGLCGSFNTNVLKEASRFVLERSNRPVSLGVIGRKARDFFRRRHLDIRYETVNIFAHLTFEHAQDVAQVVIEQFISGEVDSAFLCYNEFKSVLQQKVVVEQLLPLARIEPDRSATPVEYLYEPSPDEIFEVLLRGHVEYQIFQAMLESAAAEHAARMTAMDNATRNAADVNEQLTLYMNKVRQAAITREIIEVVSGAQALR